MSRCSGESLLPALRAKVCEEEGSGSSEYRGYNGTKLVISERSNSRAERVNMCTSKYAKNRQACEGCQDNVQLLYKCNKAYSNPITETQAKVTMSLSRET